VADRVAIIRDGRVEVVETVETLRARATARVVVTFADPPPSDALEGIPGVAVVVSRERVVELTLQGPADPLVKALARFEVVALDSREADLEDVFLSLYRRDAG
jgi:ABC-2 type transport system ATP-binding protein